MSDVSPLAGLKNFKHLYIEGSLVKDVSAIRAIPGLQGPTTLHEWMRPTRSTWNHNASTPGLARVRNAVIAALDGGLRQPERVAPTAAGRAPWWSARGAAWPR